MNFERNSSGKWKTDPLGVFWLQFRSFFTLDQENVFALWPHEEMRQRILSEDEPNSEIQGRLKNLIRKKSFFKKSRITQMTVTLKSHN